MKVFKRAYIDYGTGFIGGRPKGYYVCAQYDIVCDDVRVFFYAGRYAKSTFRTHEPRDGYKHGRQSVWYQDKSISQVDDYNTEMSALLGIRRILYENYTLPH